MMLPSAINAGDMAVSQKSALSHIKVQEGDGSEAMLLVSEGGKGGNLK